MNTPQNDADKTCRDKAQEDMLEEALRLIREAASRGIPMRLMGGVAIGYRASPEALRALDRPHPDLDFVIRRKDSRRVADMFSEFGYEPNKRFNALRGESRLLFDSPDGTYGIDIFVDRLRMSHDIDFSERLETEETTLPAAELLLCKLQIAKINLKDIQDVALLLVDHEVANEDGERRLNIHRVEGACAGDWGLFTTFTDNMTTAVDALPAILPNEDFRSVVCNRIYAIVQQVEAVPKTVRWKLRAKIGRRVLWYEVPEEVDR